jgi:hypothetical protein
MAAEKKRMEIAEAKQVCARARAAQLASRDA